MHSQKNIALSLLLTIVLCVGLACSAVHGVQAASLASLSWSDEFGYTAELTDGINIVLDVCNDSGHQEVNFSDNPEIFAGPFSAGFSFPYYENSYSEIYISLNGLLSTTQTDLNTVDNLPTPSDLLPNNIIAPFWMDLTFSETVPTGKVCYVTGTETVSGRKYLAVEWYQVKPNDINEPFTFQTLLFNDGEILFQYLTLPTDTTNATIGIEDSEGVFGLHLFHNESGLTENSNISVIYPAYHAGGRFVPSYSSGFLIQQEVDLPILLQNIGGTGTTITYDLAISDSPVAGCSWDVPAGWSVAFYDQNQKMLSSTDGNQCPEIGISSGNETEITARIRAPQGVNIGDYYQFSLSAIPKISNSLPVHMTLQAAVPASFAQAFVKNVQSSEFIPMQLALIWDKNLAEFIAGNIYSGKNLALTQTGKGGYFYAWERYYDCSGNRCSYLLGTLFNETGNLIKSLDITPYPNTVLDQELTISSTPDGNIAVAWVRNTNQLLINIYSSTGNSIKQVLQIANTTGISSPRISAGQNNRFYITWMQQSDIYYTVLDSTGNRVNATNKKLTNSNTNFSPAITALTDGNAVIAYALDINNGTTTQPLGYQIISSTGTLVQGEKRIVYPDDPHVRGIDMVQLSNGNILVVWTDEGTHHVQYVLLTNGTGWNASSVSELIPDYQVGAIHASATSDYLGHGIITWAEESQENRTLNYALIDGSGDLITPPMAFMSGVGLDSNAAGQGNAPYDGRLLLFIPLVQR